MATAPTPGTAVPPLRDGDRMDRFEFERRWEVMPHVKKAELIGGVVRMAAALAFEGHGEEHVDLVTWLGNYRASTPGTRAGDNSSVRLDLDNEPQPDVLLLIAPERGGSARIEDRHVVGAPELVAEVSSSSETYDTRVKLPLYQRHGVRECLIWRTGPGAIDWYVLRGDRYELLTPGLDGVTRSEAFPGLWLDAAAMAAGDLTRVNQVLRQGLASPEHAAFATRLRAAGGGGP